MTIGHSKAEQVECPYIDENYSCTGVLQHREIKKVPIHSNHYCFSIVNMLSNSYYRDKNIHELYFEFYIILVEHFCSKPI